MTQVAVIYNPVAGRGRALDLVERLREGLAEQGAEVQILATQKAGDGTRLASELPSEVDRIFVVGGDGTLREVASGILQTGRNTELAHIPLGNANVVARELGISLDPNQAIQELLEGHPESFDVLEVNGHLVLAMVGVGYDAQLAAGMQRARSGFGKTWYRLHGDSLYGIVGSLCLFKPELRRFELTVNGQPLSDRFTGCIVSNMRTYAKGWAPNPGANPQDGLMNYQALKPGWLPSTAISLFAAAQHKRLPRRLATRGSATDLLIRSNSPFHWQADGDAMGKAQELHIKMRPGCLRLLVPA